MQKKKKNKKKKGEKKKNSLSPSICQASATTLSRSPLFAEIVTISGCMHRGSMTLRVCAVGEDESVMFGDWFEGGIRLVRSIGDGNESRFVFGMGHGLEETET